MDLSFDVHRKCLFFVSVRTYYDEGSMMLSDDITMLSDLLLGLNSIDFRLNTAQML